MANQLRGEAQFEHEGETYTLVFDNETFFEIEDRFGDSIIDLVGEIDEAQKAKKSPKLGTIRKLLWGGLSREHPNADLAEITDILLAGNPATMTAFEKALAGALPSAKPGNGRAPAKKPGPRKKAGTGKSS